MEIAQHKVGTIVCVELIGNMDAATAPEAEKAIVPLIAAGERNLVIDFARLEYISSAGLRVMLVAAKKMKSAGGHLRLAAVKEPIMEVFELAGFADIFTFCATREDASKELQGVPSSPS